MRKIRERLHDKVKREIAIAGVSADELSRRHRVLPSNLEQQLAQQTLTLEQIHLVRLAVTAYARDKRAAERGLKECEWMRENYHRAGRWEVHFHARSCPTCNEWAELGADHWDLLFAGPRGAAIRAFFVPLGGGTLAGFLGRLILAVCAGAVLLLAGGSLMDFIDPRANDLSPWYWIVLGAIVGGVWFIWYDANH